MKKIISAVGIAIMISVCILFCFVFAATPQPVLSHEAEQFKAFANAYVTAYDSYRLAKFEREVKGELIDWEGMVLSVSPTGEFFDMIPHNGPARENCTARLRAAVFLKEGDFVPSHFKLGTKVRVRGKISSCGVLSVIVQATAVSEIL